MIWSHDTEGMILRIFRTVLILFTCLSFFDLVTNIVRTTAIMITPSRVQIGHASELKSLRLGSPPTPGGVEG